MARCIYYDTETTGVRAEKDYIIEIAAFCGTTNESFVRLVNPGVPIPKEATAIHHITDEMVKEAPSFKEVGREFIEFCGSDSYLVAHNNDNFDYWFLKTEFGRHALEMPPWKFVDTLKWARKYRPDLPRHPLQFLREVYGIKENNAHRALDDVLVMKEIFDQMFGDLPIETVHQLLYAEKGVNAMPFGKHKGKPLEEVPSDYVAWLAKDGFFEKPENRALQEAFEKLGKLNALNKA